MRRKEPLAGGSGRKSNHNGNRHRSTRERPARPFAVVAIKPRGARVVVGRCTTIAEAEAQAAKHRRFTGVTGARIVVERVGSAP